MKEKGIVLNSWIESGLVRGYSSQRVMSGNSEVGSIISLIVDTTSYAK